MNLTIQLKDCISMQTMRRKGTRRHVPMTGISTAMVPGSFRDS